MKLTAVTYVRVLSLLAFAFPLAALAATTIVDDTLADGNSRNQNLPQNSLDIFDGRTGPTGTSSTSYSRTDLVGSMTLGMTSTATSSQAFWAFFTGAQTLPGAAWTNPAPISLGVGDTVSVSVSFSAAGLANGQEVRCGLLNSMTTRNTNNLTGGHNNSTFADDTGYSLQFFTGSSGAAPAFIIGKRNLATATALGTSGLNNMFNDMSEFDTLAGTGSTTRQALASATSYTLTYSAFRESATKVDITATLAGGGLVQPYTWSAADPDTPVTAFDQFAFRIAGVSFASALTVTELNVQYTPALPVITAQPTFSTGTTSQTVGIGGQVTMSVTATGTGLTYQWQQDNTPVPGATSASLTLTNLQLSQSGSYTVVVSNGGGTVTSDAITLTVTTDNVNPPPTITTQPVSQTVNFGTPVTMSVVADGNALTYQWFKDGAIIPGATSPSLTFGAVQASDAGDYRVNVSNDGGTLPSNVVTLTVLSTTLTLNSLLPANGATAICTDTHVNLTFAGPPVLGPSGLIKIIDATTNLPVDSIDLSSSRANFLNLPMQTKTIGTLGNFNYFPVIISGNQAAIYFRNNVLGYNKTYYITVDPGVFRDGQGIFPGVTDPNTWRFTTKLVAPAAGSTLINVAADGTGDFATVQGAIDFIPAGNTTPRQIFIHRGTYTEMVYFTGKHSLTFLGEDRFQSLVQYANNNNFNNATGTYHRGVFMADHVNNLVIANLTIKNTTPLGGSQAEALLLNGTNSSRAIVTGVDLTSFQDTLQINGQGYISDSHISGNTDFMWGIGPNFFVNCELTADAQGGYYTQIRNPDTATSHGNVYLNCRLDALPGISGLYLGRIDPTVFPFSEVVYLNCAMGSQILPAGWLLNNATSAPNIHFWEYNSHDFNGTPIDVSQRLADSRQLTLANDATTIANYSTPSYVLGNAWTPQLAPIIVTQPGAQTVDLGASGTLSVGVVAIPAPTYQWFHNGAAIPGATNSAYAIPNVGGGDAGTYSVVVTNAFGTVTSSTVPLVVNGGPPVIILDPKNQSALEGATASFSVAAIGNGPFTYQWNKDGTPIGGATRRSLRLTNVQASAAANYSVTVSNSGGAASGPTTSATAALTVVPAAAAVPALPIIPDAFFDVADYGAVGDGATDNTVALQAAINAARDAGGGTIELPPAAGAYLTGPITLYSNENLQIDDGAILQALPFGTYPNSLSAPAHLITITSGSTNVELSGSGTIEGNGAAWWAADNAGQISNRPRLVQFTHATNVLMTALTLRNAPQFHVALSSANTNVTIFGLTISAPSDSPNTDGIDPAGTNMLIQNCAIGVGDDNIAVKPQSVLCGNITIANCAFGVGHGLSVGGQTNTGLDGMNVFDCTFNGTTSGLRLKADATQGGPVQNITYSNLTMTNVGFPIVFYSYYNQVGTPGAISGSNQTTPAKVLQWNASPPNALSSSTIPIWRNITINNLTATGATGYSTIWGLPLASALIQNLTFNNVTISGGPGLEIYDATNVQFTGNTSVGALTTANALAITSPPQDRAVTVGDTVSFSATAVGTSGVNNTPPTYQWMHDGAPVANGTLVDGTVVAGATTASLVLTNVHVAEAGSYTVIVSNTLDGYDVAASSLVPDSLPVSATSSAATLTVAPLPATLAFSDLSFAYDGQPIAVSVTTDPANLPVSITYNGSPTPPTIPGAYEVVAVITDPNFTGSITGTLVISSTALVRHSPTIYGEIDGSIQVLLPENIALNSTTLISGDVLVPGTPTVVINGNPTYGSTIDSSGSAQPSNYTIKLNGSVLSHVVRRVNPIPMPTVTAPPLPLGTQDITLTGGKTVSDFTQVRDLTLGNKAGNVAVPPGTYGNFTAGSKTAFIFGVAGASTPAVYNLQRLTLNKNSQLQIVGPVILTLANGVTVNTATMGNPDHPEWLTLNAAASGLTSSGVVTIDGTITAPSGTISLDGGTTINGRVVADRLTINSGDVVNQIAP